MCVLPIYIVVISCPILSLYSHSIFTFHDAKLLLFAHTDKKTSAFLPFAALFLTFVKELCAYTQTFCASCRE